MEIALMVAIFAGLLYLICDAIGRYTAVMELARLVFLAAMFAFLFSFK